MSGEIEVSETPNWLNELEAKREKRLKARLGHEAGAGAPCLKCGDKCPGLDLHFWRKCCKICKCPKEEHEVQDDDIYGWAQFQLLGSKPNKIKRKILLPGKNDEIDLEWVPKGHNDTIDKYLKTLPPEQLPVKGSQAAQDRKQLLQKQIPIHDIDPSLCHELTEEELNKMNEYISHVKQASAGVGQIVSLSSIIKGKLHMLNPSEAAIIASRYAKGVPISEIVKLQGQNKTSALGQSLEKISLNNKNLPNFVPNILNQTEDTTNPLVSTKMHDKEYALYSNDANKSSLNPQFCSALGPKQFKNLPNHPSEVLTDLTIDQKYLQNPNFDPKNRPSNFLTSNMPYNHNFARDTVPMGKSPIEFNSENSAFVPYQKISTAPKLENNYLEHNPLNNPNFSKNMSQNADQNLRNINNYRGVENNEQIYENISDLKQPPGSLPSYAPGKFNTYAEVQSPTRIPKNVKDLAFSTYEPGQINSNEQFKNENGFKIGKYRHPGSYAQNANAPKNSDGFRPIEAGNYQNMPQSNQHFEPINPNISRGTLLQPKSGDVISHNAQFEPIGLNVFNSNSYPLNSTNLKARELESGIDQMSGHHGSKSYSGSNPNLPNQNIDSSLQNYATNMETNSNVPFYSSLESGDLSGSNPNSSDPAYNIIPSNQKYGYNLGKSSNEPYYPGNPTGLGPKDNQNALDPTYDKIHSNQKYGFNIENVPNIPYYTGHPTALRSDNLREHNANVDNQMYATEPSNQKYGYKIENASNNPYYPGHPAALKSDDLRKHNPNVDNQMYSTEPGNQEYGENLERSNEHRFGGSPLKSNKQLSELHPSDLKINEDFLNPSHVNIGLIQDINYPDIKTATHETGDFYEEYSPDSIKEILNNVILPDCHYCKKPFEENEFAVTIDRANVLFHASCFKCAGCNQILADNVYFYNKETDNVYCLRDYAKIRGFPRCKACDELIFTKEYCLAENSTFHLKHFCCTECDMPLAGQDYLLEDEMPYCLPCFEQNKASKCNTCGKVIKPDEVGCTLKGIHFHAIDVCFACKVCKTPLMGKKLLLRNDQLYCSHECFGVDR